MLLPIFKVENALECVVLHVIYDKVIEALLDCKWTQTNRVEVDHLISHILEDAIERQIVVLAQCQLEECHLFLVIVALPKLVVQEAAEELDVAPLGSNCERFAVLCARVIVVMDGLFVGLKHAQEDKQRADHHARATLACLAVHDNHWLIEGLINVVIVFLVVLLHSLQEEGSVQAESEHFLQIGDIVIQEGELACGKGRHSLGRVAVASLDAQVVYLDHITVVLLEELHNVRLPVPVHALKASGGEAARNDAIRDVGQIQVVAAFLQSDLVCGDYRADPVARAAV